MKRSLSALLLALPLLLTTWGAARTTSATAPPAPLLFTTMTHMEASFLDDQDPDIFHAHVEQLRYGMKLFETYGAKMTIESEKPFARANAIWGTNVLLEAIMRGHGVGTHCDIGFNDPPMPIPQFAALLHENKVLVDDLVGAENNRGCSGAGGVNDWALAADMAGFDYVNGIVGMHYLSMPLQNRPDGWTDEYIRQVAFHEQAPVDLAQRMHPFMVADAVDFVADEDGVILVSAGDLGRLDYMAEDGACAPDCPLTFADTNTLVRQILAAAALHDPTRVGKLSAYLPVDIYSHENEAPLRYFLMQMRHLETEGIITWATQGEVLDTYSAWNP
ncbi:MAG: hypothetical protein H6650_05775 [Ardenticatenales bacterium]|nr:hypothetical protein [Ardenticatenales bacterium]